MEIIMFDIDEFIEEIKIEKKIESCYETGLPGYLKESLRNYKTGLLKIKNREPYLHIDCDFCDLQASINSAEVDQEISEKQAAYLRRTYLYDKQ